MNKRISVHHIGARNASRVFPVLEKFEQDIINVLYDADPGCLEHIRQRSKQLKSELHVLPYCVGDVCKTAYFYINYDPFTSSLYEANPEYNKWYCFCVDHDYIWEDVSKKMQKRKIEVVTLDHIFKDKNTSPPPPDFLSIDTQGSEYEILSGAKETLKAYVVAVAIESEFHPIYKGQKLFGDLVKLMSDMGFDFVRFLNLYEFSPARAPVGLRGEGFHAGCDALFLRRINNINDTKDDLERYLMLRKLALISIVFHQFEYGLECLKYSKNATSLPFYGQDGPNYLIFLRELEERIKKIPALYPVTFASKYPSFESSKARSECLNTDKTDRAGKTKILYIIKHTIKRIPAAYQILRRIKWALILLFSKKIFFTLKRFLMGYSIAEKVLISYGLNNQAKILRKNRIVHTQFLNLKKIRE